MKNREADLTCETDYFSARQDGAVVIFTPKGNQLLTSTVLRIKEAVLQYFQHMENHPEVRIVLLMPQTCKARREEYLLFFDMLRSSRISDSSVMRLYRAIDQFILKIIASDLFFISADCGQILPMLAGISLSCDYRILGDNAVFQNPALELGLIPKGGNAWFLSRMLGRGKALELILAQKGLGAREALTLGLVNRCIPMEDFETEALSIAKQFEALPETSLRLGKKMVNHCWKDLSEFLEFESQELFKLMPQIKLRPV
jgi:2-(1,2-epoxy-1,2-dihydrophenyl)acetyl-CoA isomerase